MSAAVPRKSFGEAGSSNTTSTSESFSAVVRPRVFSSDFDVAAKPQEYYKKSSNLINDEVKMENRRRGRPLKSVIKEFKERSIKYIEDKCDDEGVKRSPLVITLAKQVYRDDFEKAMEILTASLLPEAKLLLMKM